MSSNMKTEVSKETYQGKAATHSKMTSTMTTPMAATTITDMYIDVSGVSLGGHIKMISNGQTVMDQDIPPGDTSKAPKDPNTDKTVQYTFVGVEPVTVPGWCIPGRDEIYGNHSGNDIHLLDCTGCSNVRQDGR